MKLIVRSLVLSLAVTGVIASSYAMTPTVTSTSKTTKTSAMPVPRCEPGSGSCGLGTW